MKTISFTAAILSALALGRSSLVNAKSSSDLRTFATELGLSKTDVNALIDSYQGSSNKRVQDLSCQVLEFIFPNSTNLPTESAYQAKVDINWSTRAWLNATCVFSPSSTKATSIGVKVANFFNTQFAIRSGGHSPDPNIASTEEGLLFSLENLNQINLDTSKNIASIGPGNRWGHVYETLEAKSFLVVGGRVPPVGVGGLLTGGGLSYFSGTEGFAADNVKNYEVVLGDGSIVNANASKNSDLWWALKGGSNNFGIVTRFDVKAIPKDKGLIWGGNLYFVPAQIPGVLAAINKFQTEGQVADPKAAIIVSFIKAPASAFNDAYDVARITVFHQDAKNATPPSLQPFFDVAPVQNSATIRTLSSLAADTYGPATTVPPMRQLFRDLSVGVSAEHFEWASDLFNQTFSNSTFASIPGGSFVFTSQPISVAIIDAGNSTGGNPLGASRTPQSWLIISVQWALESDDKFMITACKDFLDAVDAKAKEMGVDEDFLYLNDAAGDQPVMKSYGKANLARLRKISKKYDPQQVFQKQVTGGFKL